MNPFASVYVESNRRCDLVKALGWDLNGFWLLFWPLAQDRFIYSSEQDVATLTVEELHGLLKGIDIGVVPRHIPLACGN